MTDSTSPTTITLCHIVETGSRASKTTRPMQINPKDWAAIVTKLTKTQALRRELSAAIRRAEKAEAGMKDAIAMARAVGVVFDAWAGHPLTTTWPPQIDAYAEVRDFLKQHGGAS